MLDQLGELIKVLPMFTMELSCSILAPDQPVSTNSAGLLDPLYTKTSTGFGNSIDLLAILTFDLDTWHAGGRQRSTKQDQMAHRPEVLGRRR
jgi:hypothetical protein